MTKEKELTATGKYGTFKGKVVIKTNYRRQTKQVHNRGTHDEEMRTFDYHIVKGYIGEKEFASSEEFIDINQVLFHAKSVEKTLQNYLNMKADTKPSINVEDELSKRGYK